MLIFVNKPAKNKIQEIYSQKKENRNKMLSIYPTAPNHTQTKRQNTLNTVNSTTFKSQNITKREMFELLSTEAKEARLARLFNNIRNMINETRAKMRKKKMFPLEPVYKTKSNADGNITLKTIPNNRENDFMLEMEKNDIIDRLFVNKQMANDNIIYQQEKKTEYGSVITKSTNLKDSFDTKLINSMQEKLYKYLRYFLTRNSKNETSDYANYINRMY